MFQPNFVTFTNTDITDHNHPLGGNFRGQQNNGFHFVLFADGSGGVVKNLKDWVGNKTGRLYPAEILAAQEYLAARVGEAMNAPVRDCRFYGNDGTSVIMPFIEGDNGEVAGQDAPPFGPQAIALALFDYLTANADRRPKNWLWTPDRRIVGIDHALCNFRPRKPESDFVALLWNNGVSLENLLIVQPKLQNLAVDFHQVGMGSKHETMMQNLSRLIAAFQILSNHTSVEKGGPGSGRHPENPHGDLAKATQGDNPRLSDEFTTANEATAKLINQGQTLAELDDDEIRGKQKAAVVKDITARLVAKYGEKFDKQLFTLIAPKGTHDYKTPEDRQEAREGGVSILVHNWAHTANDSKPRSLAIQEAARDEFGLQGAADWFTSAETQADADADYAKNGDLYRAFLRAQYESTQEYLAKGGVTQLGLFRGVSGITEKYATNLRPLSSWAYDASEARMFCGENDGSMFASIVPADRVLSCARTGIGCLNEAEVVVLGSPKPENSGAVTVARIIATGDGGTYAISIGADLNGANLANADLHQANLSNIDFRGANLSRCDLRLSNLYGANLSGVNLSYSDFGLANLKYANLSDADLSNVYISNAHVEGATFYGANVSGAHIGGCEDDEDTVWPDGYKMVNGRFFQVDEVEKGGPGSGRHPEGITKPHLQYIASAAADFFANGGTVKILDPEHLSDKDKEMLLTEQRKAHEQYEALRERNFAVQREQRTNPSEELQRELSQVRQKMDAASLYRNVCRACYNGGASVKNAKLYIAYEPTGEIAGLLYGKENPTNNSVEAVVSLGQGIKHEGTALEYLYAKEAAQRGVGIRSEQWGDSRGYHERIGRTLTRIAGGETSSKWTKAQVREIAALDIPNAVATVSKGGPGSGRHPEGVEGKTHFSTDDKPTFGQYLSAEDAKAITAIVKAKAVNFKVTVGYVGNPGSFSSDFVEPRLLKMQECKDKFFASYGKSLGFTEQQIADGTKAINKSLTSWSASGGVGAVRSELESAAVSLRAGNQPATDLERGLAMQRGYAQAVLAARYPESNTIPMGRYIDESGKTTAELALQKNNWIDHYLDRSGGLTVSPLSSWSAKEGVAGTGKWLGESAALITSDVPKDAVWLAYQGEPFFRCGALKGHAEMIVDNSHPITPDTANISDPHATRDPYAFPSDNLVHALDDAGLTSGLPQNPFHPFGTNKLAIVETKNDIPPDAKVTPEQVAAYIGVGRGYYLTDGGIKSVVWWYSKNVQRSQDPTCNYRDDERQEGEEMKALLEGAGIRNVSTLINQPHGERAASIWKDIRDNNITAERTYRLTTLLRCLSVSLSATAPADGATDEKVSLANKWADEVRAMASAAVKTYNDWAENNGYPNVDATLLAEMPRFTSQKGTGNIPGAREKANSIINAIVSSAGGSQ